MTRSQALAWERVRERLCLAYLAAIVVRNMCKLTVGLKLLPFRLVFALLPVLLVLPSLAARDSSNQVSQIPNSYPEYGGAPGNLSVAARARLVTVRIIGEQSTGSGVIIERIGQTYTVLTNAHVALEAGGEVYTILTADGRTHSGYWLRKVEFGNYDLALVQFTSASQYQVAQMGNSDALTVGEFVYASGFPRWRVINSNTLEDTRDWGVNAFELTQGQVGMLSSKPLQNGYQIGYTNQIAPGMSGGPILDRYGHLVGINGGLKYPVQGISAFIFADGTMPSQALFQQMETFSWAIPIATFQRLFRPPTNSVVGF